MLWIVAPYQRAGWKIFSPSVFSFLLTAFQQVAEDIPEALTQNRECALHPVGTRGTAASRSDPS